VLHGAHRVDPALHVATHDHGDGPLGADAHREVAQRIPVEALGAACELTTREATKQVRVDKFPDRDTGPGLGFARLRLYAAAHSTPTFR
jgi:hypothetical protein